MGLHGHRSWALQDGKAVFGPRCQCDCFRGGRISRNLDSYGAASTMRQIELAAIRAKPTRHSNNWDFHDSNIAAPAVSVLTAFDFRLRRVATR